MERIGTDQREQHVFDQAARGATGRILSGCQKQNDRVPDVDASSD
jgi:hypothetical protein